MYCFKDIEALLEMDSLLSVEFEDSRSKFKF